MKYPKIGYKHGLEFRKGNGQGHEPEHEPGHGPGHGPEPVPWKHRLLLIACHFSLDKDPNLSFGDF